jgi:D-glycero-alpha-D-manno-heptose-7-phosphate kinase
VLICRSPVRISFAGGGTDLPSYYERYGGIVISTTINRYFYTVLQKRHDGKIQVISSDLQVSETWEDIRSMDLSRTSIAIPLAVLKEMGCSGLALDMFMSSEIPPGTGLGSSACVCVNVIKALSTYLGISMSRYKQAEVAFHIARKVLNKPVGKQDEYASAFGGLNKIEFFPDGSTNVTPIALEPELLKAFEGNLMLFFTGASHDSWKILKQQEESTRSDERVIIGSLHRIRDLSGAVLEAFKVANIHRVGELLHEGWLAKRKLSGDISTSRIDDLYNIARSNGAVGGKITGAGGGGFLVLYCEKKHQPAVREAFAREGLREMSFQFDSQGSSVVVNDPFLDGDDRCDKRWTLYSNHRVTQRSELNA